MWLVRWISITKWMCLMCWCRSSDPPGTHFRNWRPGISSCLLSDAQKPIFMVLILNGNSEVGAHILNSETGNLIFLIDNSRKFDTYFENDLISFTSAQPSLSYHLNWVPCQWLDKEMAKMVEEQCSPHLGVGSV